MFNELALRRAVIDNPKDDLPRNVFADYLDDRSEPGDDLRAKFIRDQLRLAEIQDPTYASRILGRSTLEGQDVWDDYEQEKRDLKRTISFAEEGFLHGLSGFSRFSTDVPVGLNPAFSWRTVKTHYRRGFMYHVETTMAEFMGDPCQCRGNPVLTKCTVCNGLMHMNGGIELFKLNPIEYVTITDKVPVNFSDVPFLWDRDMRDVLTDNEYTLGSSDSSYIPGAVFDLMTGETGSHYFVVNKPGDRRYQTQYNAIKDLSDGCHRLGKLKFSPSTKGVDLVTNS